MHTICNISTKYYKSAACRTQRAGGEWSIYGGTYKKMQTALDKARHPLALRIFLCAAVRRGAGILLACGVLVGRGHARLCPQRRHSSSAAAFPPCIFWCFWPRHFLKQNLALKTAVLVFLAGLCFVFANPPMQAPDETMHFLRAYAVGSGQFLFDEKQQFPNDVNLLVRDFPGAYINGVSGEKLAPDDPTIADAFARYSADKAAGAVAPGAFTPVQQLVPYFPQALAWPWDGCSARTRWPVCIWRARRTCCASRIVRLRGCGHPALFGRADRAGHFSGVAVYGRLVQLGRAVHGPDMDIYRAVPFGRCDEKEGLRCWRSALA